MRLRDGRSIPLLTFARCAVALLAVATTATPLFAAQQQDNGIPPAALPINLLVNPDLDGNLNGWSPIGNTTYDANEDQTGNNPQSGVALASETGGNGAALTQCVNLPTFWRSVTFSMSYFTRAAISNGSSFGQVQFFSGANCSGAFLSQQEQFGPSSSTFQKVALTGLTPPIDSQSARLTYGVQDSDPTQPATAVLDTFFFGYFELAGNCATDPTLLCVNANRFQVTATFALKCRTGSTSANGVRDTDQGGFLWCFDPTNPELFVKVLNACQPSVGNTYWVFIAGLTNVGVSITVTDTQTGMHKTYTNPANTDFKPVLDTAGLPVCP